MKAITHLVYALCYLLSLLPLRVHYIFSDVVLFPLLFHGLKYRRDLVQRNLRTSFPERSAAELREVERAFYHWLADYFVETLKLASISAAEMQKRMHFDNIADIVEQLEAEGGRNCFLYLGHFGNWEWVSSLPLGFGRPTAMAKGQIYHPLHSVVADGLFLRLRERFGVRCIAMKETLRVLMGFHRAGRTMMVGFISDQSPKFEAMHHWTTFLHRDTSFFTGAEKIGRKLDARFFYVEMTRPRRGYYRATLREIPMSEPTPAHPYPVTDAFAAAMEASIRRNPHLWLWTHNRWKRTREDWERRALERKAG